MNSVLSNIFGFAAAIAMILGYLPQALYTIKTRSTESLSLPAWIGMGAGAIFFVVQGFLTKNYPLVITNFITGTCSIIIIIMKITNDCAAKRHKGDSSSRQENISSPQV